jgi:hypothetical protein
VDRRLEVPTEEHLDPCGVEPAGGKVVVLAVVVAAAAVETGVKLAFRCRQPTQLFEDEVDASACLPSNFRGAVCSAAVDILAEGNS